MRYATDARAVHGTAGRPILVCTLAAAATVPLLLAGFGTPATPARIALGAACLTLLCLAALALVTGLAEAAGGIARWRMGPWYLLWAALAFGLASFTWLGPQSGSVNRIHPPSVVDAMVVVGVLVAVWTAGYCIGAPRQVRDAAGRLLSVLLRGTSPVVRGGAMPWVLYGVGSAARLATAMLAGRFGYVGDPSVLVSSALPYGQLLHIVSTFTLFAVAAAAYRAFSDTTRGSKTTLWVLVGCEVCAGALAGGKESFVLSVLAVLIPYGAVRGRVSLRILLPGTLVFLLVAVPFNTAYRQVVRSEQITLSPADAVAAAPETATAVIASGPPGATLLDSATAILRRIRLVDSVAIITQLTPDTVPYRNPLELGTAPLVGLVPRAVWPGKPVVVSGYEFSQEYYGLPSDVYTSTAITPLGDLYRHGGWLTAVAGIIVLGAACRLFDALFHPEKDPRAICFLLVFLPMIVKSELDVYSLVMAVPMGILTAAAGAHLICRTGTGAAA